MNKLREGIWPKKKKGTRRCSSKPFVGARNSIASIQHIRFVDMLRINIVLEGRYFMIKSDFWARSLRERDWRLSLLCNLPLPKTWEFLILRHSCWSRVILDEMEWTIIPEEKTHQQNPCELKYTNWNKIALTQLKQLPIRNINLVYHGKRISHNISASMVSYRIVTCLQCPVQFYDSWHSYSPLLLLMKSKI